MSTAHLGNVKDIKIIDFGAGANGGSTTSKFGSVPVEILTKMFTGFQGTGFDMSNLLNLLGIKPEDAANLITKAAEEPKPHKK